MGRLLTRSGRTWSVEDDLRFAGVFLPAVPFSAGDPYWDAFCAAVDVVTRFVRGQVTG